MLTDIVIRHKEFKAVFSHAIIVKRGDYDAINERINLPLRTKNVHSS